MQRGTKTHPPSIQPPPANIESERRRTTKEREGAHTHPHPHKQRAPLTRREAVLLIAAPTPSTAVSPLLAPPRSTPTTPTATAALSGILPAYHVYAFDWMFEEGLWLQASKQTEERVRIRCKPSNRGEPAHAHVTHRPLRPTNRPCKRSRDGRHRHRTCRLRRRLCFGVVRCW